MSDTDSPSKPFKQSENDETTQTLTTDHVLPATGNDASGNSYCEDSLDDKKTAYGFDKEKDEAPGKTSSPSPGPASDTASPKKLNPTAATFIFQSKDGAKPGRALRSSLGNSSPRGGHRQGADGFTPRNPSFTGRGGARTPSSGRPRGQTPVSSPSTPVSESTAATIGEGSAGANEDEGKQPRGANVNVPVNREPRGYVPPPPTKRVSALGRLHIATSIQLIILFQFCVTLRKSFPKPSSRKRWPVCDWSMRKPSNDPKLRPVMPRCTLLKLPRPTRQPSSGNRNVVEKRKNRVRGGSRSRARWTTRGRKLGSSSWPGSRRWAVVMRTAEREPRSRPTRGTRAGESSRVNSSNEAITAVMAGGAGPLDGTRTDRAGATDGIEVDGLGMIGKETRGAKDRLDEVDGAHAMTHHQLDNRHRTGKPKRPRSRSCPSRTNRLGRSTTWKRPLRPAGRITPTMTSRDRAKRSWMYRVFVPHAEFNGRDEWDQGEILGC